MGKALGTDDVQFLAQTGLDPFVERTVAPAGPLPGSPFQLGKSLGLAHAAKGGKDGGGKIPVAPAALGELDGVIQGLGAVGEEIAQFFGAKQPVPFAGGALRGKARELGIEVDGPQHPVQFQILGLAKNDPAGRHRRQAQPPGVGQGAVHVVPRRKFHMQPGATFAGQFAEQFRVVAENGKPLAELAQGFGEPEIGTTMKRGEQPAQVGVAFGVAGQQHRTVIPGERFGADDRADAGFGRLVEKLGDAVQTIAVGKGHPGHAQLPGPGAEFRRGAYPPAGGEGRMDVQMGEHR